MHAASQTPPAICLLADHLDAMLAAGEDLLKLAPPCVAPGQCDAANADWQRLCDLINQARTLENALLARTLQARFRARDVGRQGGIIGSLLKLFIGGTTQLADTATALAKRRATDFNAGLDPLAYLRSRGILAADAASVVGATSIAFNEDFLVSGQMPLRQILDLAAAMLDALDAHYTLFPDAGDARSSGRARFDERKSLFLPF